MAMNEAFCLVPVEAFYTEKANLYLENVSIPKKTISAPCMMEGVQHISLPPNGSLFPGRMVCSIRGSAWPWLLSHGDSE